MTIVKGPYGKAPQDERSRCYGEEWRDRARAGGPCSSTEWEEWRQDLAWEAQHRAEMQALEACVGETMILIRDFECWTEDRTVDAGTVLRVRSRARERLLCETLDETPIVYMVRLDWLAPYRILRNDPPPAPLRRRRRTRAELDPDPDLVGQPPRLGGFAVDPDELARAHEGEADGLDLEDGHVFRWWRRE